MENTNSFSEVDLELCETKEQPMLAFQGKHKWIGFLIKLGLITVLNYVYLSILTFGENAYVVICLSSIRYCL